jgi:hypothetical protein
MPPKAVLLLRRRVVLDEDAFADLVLWRVPRPVPGCTHAYKYRLAYVRAGHCLVRYDNEAGKGDHRHLGPLERPYRFTDPDTLLADFRHDIGSFRDEDRDP